VAGSAKAVSASPRPRRAAHPVDEVLPVPKLAVYGVQHVLAFYAGAVLVPILLASAIGLDERQLIHLINADLFTCGIALIIQSIGFWKIGVRLPLVQGVTFTAVSPMIAIGLAAGGRGRARPHDEPEHGPLSQPVVQPLVRPRPLGQHRARRHALDRGVVPVPDRRRALGDARAAVTRARSGRREPVDQPALTLR
jgi:hypothetical protein